jgi:hypothetical protein
VELRKYKLEIWQWRVNSRFYFLKNVLVIIWICVNYIRIRLQNWRTIYTFITSPILLWSPAGSVGVTTDLWAVCPKTRDLISGEVKDFPEDWSVLKYDALTIGTYWHFGKSLCVYLQVLRAPLFLDYSDLEEWRRYFLRNIENYLPLDAVIYFRLLEYSSLPFWVPRITPRLFPCQQA